MGTFHVHCDFNKLDGQPSMTSTVDIQMNTQIIGPNGTLFDNYAEKLVDGILDVDLPANDNAPGDFGYVFRRAVGLTKIWRVPAQDPGASVELVDFTALTPLPIPDFYDSPNFTGTPTVDGVPLTPFALIQNDDGTVTITVGNTVLDGGTAASVFTQRQVVDGGMAA